MNFEQQNDHSQLTGTAAIQQPDDPKLVAAARHAGRISYNTYPYYEWRYGERGRRFTEIDSGWITWLTSKPLSFMQQQITWLSSVLSNRGMPSFMLEQHLQILYRCLTRTRSNGDQQFQHLLTISQTLKLNRQEVLSEGEFHDLAQQFSASMGDTSSKLLVGAGRLIAASVADEFQGEKNAVESLMAWFRDVNSMRRNSVMQQQLTPAQREKLHSDNFEKTWLAALNSTVETARKQASQ